LTLVFAAQDENFVRIAIAAISATWRSIFPTGEPSVGRYDFSCAHQHQVPLLERRDGAVDRAGYQ
jgi:hypothetical protein